MTSSYIDEESAKETTSKPYLSLIESANVAPSVPFLTATRLPFRSSYDLTSLLVANTAICTPDSKYGSEKSKTCLALVGDRHAGDDAVDLIRLNRLQRRVEAQRLDVDGEALVLADVPDEVHVDADEIALVVLEFEGREGRVGGDDVVLALGLRLR